MKNTLPRTRQGELEIDADGDTWRVTYQYSEETPDTNMHGRMEDAEQGQDAIVDCICVYFILNASGVGGMEMTGALSELPGFGWGPLVERIKAIESEKTRDHFDQ